MTDPVEDDIIPTVDKIVYMQQDGQAQFSDTDDNDDLHVCRKCNKVFKNLPEYLEHKVKYENYRISQTRSKLDRRMVLPQLVQKQKRKEKKKKVNNTGKGETVRTTQDECVNSKSEQADSVGYELLLEKCSVKEGDVVACKPEENSGQGQLPKKRGRKRKSIIPQISATNSDLKIMYMCTECDKKFRREATLRWHMKYEHKDDKDNGDDSEDEQNGEVLSGNDRDFRVEMEKEENGDHHFEEDGKKLPQEIHVIIEQPQHLDKLGAAEDLQAGDASNQPQKLTIIKYEKEDQDSGRPYVCDICDRRFKEMTVLKAHAVVHSDERKYICTAENCPYGFKTKGGLVRHLRRHTGERPYACENCGRAFSESGALTRHMKSRRNCAQTPDSAYPRYMKNWTYHPNIPAVIDPSQRDVHQGRSTLQHSDRMGPAEETEGEIHYLITGPADSNILKAEVGAPHADGLGDVITSVENSEVTISQLIDVAKSDVQIKLEQEDTTAIVEWNPGLEAAHDATDIITVSSTEVMCGLDSVLEQQEVPTIAAPQLALDHQTDISDVATQEHTLADSLNNACLIDLKSRADAEFLKSTQCCVCKKDLVTMEGLEIHLRSHLADQPSRCGICHFLSNDREELRHHILSMHYDSLNNIEVTVLSMEDDEGDLKSGALQHRKVTTRDALVAVKQLYSLKKQKPSSHEVEKSCPTASGSLQCMVCNRFFRGSSYLRQHMRTHTGDRPHQCHVCHRSFTSRDILKKHMYVHKEQRDFKCGECGKLFKRLAHVQQHLRIHSQERSFRCSVCDKLFKTQNSLTVHMRTHSGVNPYKCHVCSRHFRERGSLQRHMRLHTGEKPYKCPLCNRAFAEHGTLSRHLKAKVPCSASHSVTNLDLSQASSSNLLTQFSTVVANTQQYIQHVDGNQQYIQHVDENQQYIQHVDDNQQYIQHVDGNQQFMLPTVQEMGEEYVVLDTTGKDQEEVIENVEVITDEDLPAASKADGYLNGQETESLHIFDSDTGESVIIVAEKSIVDLIREQQLSIESGEAGSSLQKIKDILHAVGNVTSVNKGEFTAFVEPQVMEQQKDETEQEEIMDENC